MSLCASLPFLEDLSGIAMSRMMHAHLSLRSPSPQTEFEAHGYRVERSASTEIRHQAAVCVVSLINTHEHKTASMTSLCASGQLLGSRPSVRLSRHANRQTCRWVKHVYAQLKPLLRGFNESAYMHICRPSRHQRMQTQALFGNKGGADGVWLLLFEPSSDT